MSFLKDGYLWVVDADIKSYFDSIPQERLMQEVEKYLADGRVLALLGKVSPSRTSWMA